MHSINSYLHYFLSTFTFFNNMHSINDGKFLTLLKSIPLFLYV